MRIIAFAMAFMLLVISAMADEERWQRGLPDLQTTASMIAVDESYAWFEVNVTNIGYFAAQNFNIWIMHGQMQRLVENVVLEPGQTYTDPWVPVPCQPHMNLAVQADSEQRIVESDEGNNIFLIGGINCPPGAGQPVPPAGAKRTALTKASSAR